MTTALLVDDEPNLVAHLERLLASHWPELDVVATAHNGREALARFDEYEPDIVFLDIRMPGLSGLDVAQRLGEDALIVFATAYDDYAVEAFETAAVDYLLKPVTADRLQQTVARLQARLGANNAPSAADIAQLLQTLNKTDQTPSDQLQWIRAGSGDTTELVPVDDVVYFKADNKYTSVMTPTAEHLVRLSIKELEARLDPNRFWRVHRGVIVNVGDIAAATRDLKGGFSLRLKRRDETLRASRTYAHRFKQM